MNHLTNYMYHRPVMLKEVVEQLDIKPDGTYVDLTFGGGGHASAILDKLKGGQLWAFDQDPTAKLEAERVGDNRLYFVEGNFRFFSFFLEMHHVGKVDGIFVDLGLSSHQLNDAARGFAVRLAGPLDMRFDQRSDLTAGEVLNTYSARQLGNIFVQYGDIQQARSLVSCIVTARKRKPLETIAQFREAIVPVLPKGREYKFYAKVFQALRIAVNDERNALQEMLSQIPHWLHPGGRFVAISYHSGEDKPIKHFMKTGNVAGERICNFYGEVIRPLEPLHKKALRPAPQEVAENNRARSARLRVARALASS